METVTTGSTYTRNRDISVMFPLIIRTKEPGGLVTVSHVSFEEKLRSSSNLVVPCARMLQRGKIVCLDKNLEFFRSLPAAGFRGS